MAVEAFLSHSLRRRCLLKPEPADREEVPFRYTCSRQRHEKRSQERMIAVVVDYLAALDDAK